MGAYGPLKIALRNPERCVAVTALCPAVFPAEPADAAPAVNRPLVLNDLNQAMGTNPETCSSNSRLRHLEAQPRRTSLCQSGNLPGPRRSRWFKLHDGQRIFIICWDSFRSPHTFRSVLGAGHADADDLVSKGMARGKGDLKQPPDVSFGERFGLSARHGDGVSSMIGASSHDNNP
jgi:S-formylglutathione hydrolase